VESEKVHLLLLDSSRQDSVEVTGPALFLGLAVGEGHEHPTQGSVFSKPAKPRPADSTTVSIRFLVS
jgi:hypothetical protein